MKGKKILKALREKVEIDNCALTDSEVEAIIDRELKEKKVGTWNIDK